MLKRLKMVLLLSIPIILSSCNASNTTLDKIYGNQIIENDKVNIEIKGASKINIITNSDKTLIDPEDDELLYYKDSDKYIFDSTDLYLNIEVNDKTEIVLSGTYINELNITSSFNSLNINNKMTKYILINDSSINDLILDCSYSDTLEINNSTFDNINIKNDHISNINLKKNIINSFDVDVIRTKIIFTNNTFTNINVLAKIANVSLFLNDKYLYNLQIDSPGYTRYVYSSKKADIFINVKISSGFVYAGYYHD